MDFTGTLWGVPAAGAGTGLGRSVVALNRNMGKTDKRFTPWGIR